MDKEPDFAKKHNKRALSCKEKASLPAQFMAAGRALIFPAAPNLEVEELLDVGWDKTNIVALEKDSRVATKLSQYYGDSLALHECRASQYLSQTDEQFSYLHLDLCNSDFEEAIACVSTLGTTGASHVRLRLTVNTTGRGRPRKAMTDTVLFNPKFEELFVTVWKTIYAATRKTHSFCLSDFYHFRYSDAKNRAGAIMSSSWLDFYPVGVYPPLRWEEFISTVQAPATSFGDNIMAIKGTKVTRASNTSSWIKQLEFKRTQCDLRIEALHNEITELIKLRDGYSVVIEAESASAKAPVTPAPATRTTPRRIIHNKPDFTNSLKLTAAQRKDCRGPWAKARKLNVAQRARIAEAHATRYLAEVEDGTWPNPEVPAKRK